MTRTSTCPRAHCHNQRDRHRLLEQIEQSQEAINRCREILAHKPSAGRLATAQRRINSEVELRRDVGRLAVGCLHEGEDRHISGIPAVHGLVTHFALCIAPLLERQTSRRHLIFGPAVGAFEDDHRFTLRLRLMT